MTCTTHHYACDCREAMYAKEIERLRSGYLADENGNEYVQVCILKEKIIELKKDHGNMEVWGIENLGLAKKRGEEIEALRAELGKARDVLRFYADTENYNYESGALKDMQPRGLNRRLYSVLEFGERAREVLASIDASKLLDE